MGNQDPVVGERKDANYKKKRNCVERSPRGQCAGRRRIPTSGSRAGIKKEYQKDNNTTKRKGKQREKKSSSSNRTRDSKGRPPPSLVAKNETR